MRKFKLKITTNNNKYNVIIDQNLLNNFLKILNTNSINFGKCLIVIDKNVPKKFIKKINFLLRRKKIFNYIFNPSEKNKSQKSVNKILNLLLKNNFHRNDCLISVGGGITGDVSSFAASIFKRGLKFVNVPSTLLAQVDSSIGGKTGVNSKYGKNLIGTFYQPDLVISDTKLLVSLNKREIICGYAEILKHALIKNKKIFKYLEKNGKKVMKLNSPYIEKAIHESCLIKKKIIEKDENEKNFRKVLNFGHTFGHAYEATLNYSKKLNHGEAVLLGINCAANFSLQRKILMRKDYLLIKNHFYKLNLPIKISKFFSKKNLNKILSFMQKDKKNNNSKINLILLKKIGQVGYKYYYNALIVNKFLKNQLVD